MTEQEIKKLWVGDKVKIIGSGKLGKYAGINKKGRIRVRWENKILLVSLSNIEKYNDDPTVMEEINEKLESINLLVTNSKINQVIKNNQNEIDLHIEKLAPHLQNEPNYIILNYQIKAFEEFLEFAIEKKKYSILVIHGKGEGVLKEEILILTKSDPRIKFSIDKNQGGATEFILA